MSVQSFLLSGVQIGYLTYSVQLESHMIPN